MNICRLLVLCNGGNFMRGWSARECRLVKFLHHSVTMGYCYQMPEREKAGSAHQNGHGRSIGLFLRQVACEIRVNLRFLWVSIYLLDILSCRNTINNLKMITSFAILFRASSEHASFLLKGKLCCCLNRPKLLDIVNCWWCCCKTVYLINIQIYLYNGEVSMFQDIKYNAHNVS